MIYSRSQSLSHHEECLGPTIETQVPPGLPTFIYESAPTNEQAVVELVSAVGGGKLTRELDLGGLAADIEAPEVQYEPEQYHGIILRFEQDGPAVLIYRSGSFSISGAESIEELHETFQALESRLRSLFENFEYETSFEVRNLVHQDKIVDESGDLESINLTALSVGLGMESIEYEPEQFPGLMYRPPEDEGLYLIFATGKIVSTGHSNPEVAREGLEMVKQRIGDGVAIA